MIEMPNPSSRFAIREIAGIPFAVTSLETAVDWLIFEAATQHLPVNVRLANSYNIAIADRTPSYAALLRDQGINFPDGAPVVWLMNRRTGNGQYAGRVRGPSLFSSTMAKSSAEGTRHFLLGSTPETLTSLQSTLRTQHPGITIVGAYSPPFSAVDREYVDNCVSEARKAQPDIIWIGLGTPKQDLVGTALATRLQLTTVNVGAAFGFAAGVTPEAPRWIQNSGFEWVFRLASEPKRLWRRYLIGGAIFVRAITRTQTAPQHAHTRTLIHDVTKNPDGSSHR